MTAPDPRALTADETMAAFTARLLVDGETVFVGIGVPSLASICAKRLHAPRMTLIYESGAIGADPRRAPLSTASPAVAENTDMFGSMLDVFGALQAGRIDVGLLSGAQGDRRGNLNSTVIGPYARPKVRLPGSGGALDIALLARRVLILMPHEPRRFVERVDFVTSPGHPDAGAAIPGAGRGAGPVAVLTDKAAFGFFDGELALTATRAGVSAADAVAGFAWRIPLAPELGRLAPPTLDESAVLLSLREAAR